MKLIPFILLAIGLVLLMYSKVRYIKETYNNSCTKVKAIDYSLYGSYVILGLAIISAIILKI